VRLEVPRDLEELLALLSVRRGSGGLRRARGPFASGRKTGARLTSIEIDERGHKTALANFKEAGVAPFIDARLAGAHQLVKELPGPYDFVFSDADKEWYTQYLKEVDPKLAAGGCFTRTTCSDPRSLSST
jgi:tRNA A58 N-methylase Trm61